MLLTLAFWRSIWRTFFIQSTWNFERMQNLGFLYAALPALRNILPAERLVPAVKRHAQFFNTHPYFASTIMGAVLKLEEEAARDPQGPHERNLNALKAGLMGSLGAVGDSLFWAALKPFSAWIGVIIAYLGHPGWAVFVFLVIYNFPHLVVRFGGASVGYAAGLDVVRQLRKVDFPGVAQRLKGAAVAAAFAALPLVIFASAHETPFRLGAIAAAGFLFFLSGRGYGGTRMAIAVLATVMLGSWIWNTIGGLG